MTEKKSAYYKGVAKSNLQNNWGTAILVCLIITAISALIGIIPVVGTIVAAIIAGPLTVAELRYFSALHRKQQPTIGTAFTDFGKEFWGKVGVYLLESLYVLLWTLLFIIPGIIKGYSYATTMFLKSKNPEIKAKEAIALSQKIMDGKKAKLFFLDLSFIGWLILSIFTLGIALIYVIPYMNASRVAFYEEAYIEYQEKTGNIVDVDAQPLSDNEIEVE